MGKKPVEGAERLLMELHTHGFDIKVVCNTTTLSTAEIHAAITGLGVSMSIDDVISGAKMTIMKMKKNNHKTICVLGEPAFCEELRSAGINVISTDMHEKVSTEAIELVKDVTAVVVAVDTKFDFHKAGLMSRYCYEQHCALYSVGGDRQFPGDDGRIMPGAYSLAVPISCASYAPINVIGKPEIVDGVDLNYDLIVVIGDNPKTDIEFAEKIHAQSILVMTGLVEPEQLPNLEKTTIVCQDLSETITNVVTKQLFQ